MRDAPAGRAVASAAQDVPGPSAAPGARLAALDCLRLLAALSVVAYHWLFWGPRYGEVASTVPAPVAALAAYGNLGVQLFFLISGFVIFLSASGRDAASFAAGRATRLYPAFWAGVLLTTATLLVTAQASLPDILGRFLANLTMVPAAFGQTQLDGVYWTLTLELQFYALVFLFLLVGRREWLEPFFAVWAITMLPTTLFLPRIAGLPLLGGLFELFAGGALIAMIARTGWTPLRAVALGASVVGSAAATVRRAQESDPGTVDPVVLVLVVAALYALVFVLTTSRVAAWHIPGSRLAGGLTYPIYLCHAVFGFALLNAFGSSDAPWAGYGIALAAVLAVAAGVHLGVERAAAPIWRRLFAVTLAAPIRALQARLPVER
ncbi:acetyltransferase [Leifsonia xyli subsp. cynodontis DSM 46306]|uniref:Acyltransferase 3 domain-containing protein n=1 Tax=Leifsonia xyli subsp. cynodontis DSM 46306 TaxID=1389489 RepID=U3P642_LEIXC|nr:acyltransferase [Leifsonia xyli]AGW40362.1 acetyltransferase [Leifsonia xyli subsp. cynodontis DSM 46306]